ncbi:hypothetical protein G7077_03215 [Sphingomonas piscis]|uniref:Uncharacterized protein n=1 Tax=Sphingomonas piscis TaxID=2714943 RepID=A0A6G7YMV9_9SPHN|nr:hypothetical protein [Sphingomonas piscis]QIK78067.1 hypothetical protein G7077_03215 [Sphingomonas piscis]
MADAKAPGTGKSVFFLFNLVQDVSILRPLIYLAARETEARLGILVSDAFVKRDRQKVWQREVAALAAGAGASLHLYGSPEEAQAVLAGGSGMIFAASESNLPAHHETSSVFLAAPSTYVRVTLQHGFECIGFRQSREHIQSHGRNIGFAADIVCGWFEAEALNSLIASQRSKLYVTGPPTLLNRSPEADEVASGAGLVCENMHSVRLRVSGDHKTSFMEMFFAFCGKMAARGERVALRPHPGGQYVLKNKVSLPTNVDLNMLPLYAFDMKSYRFGISAPSTIIFDMIVAGIPVAVWRDPGGVMDASNYKGLTEISTLDDWLAFERDVRIRPDMILSRQEAFLAQLPMPRDPSEVYRRFARLILACLTAETGHSRPLPNAGAVRPAVLSQDVLVAASA